MSTTIQHVLEARRSTPRTKDQGFLNTLVPRRQTQAKTDDLAQYLVDKFQSPDYRPVFLRIAWRLEQSYIYQVAEQALQKASNPRAYFIASCRNEMRRLGVV